METKQYMEIFIEEGEEHIQSLNNLLLALESDTRNLEYINEMFRSAHTIKGMAGTMGFRKISELTHSLENILDAARNQNLDMQSDVIDTLFAGIDSLEGLFDNILEGIGEDEYDIEPIKLKLGSYLTQNPLDMDTTESGEGRVNEKDISPLIQDYHMGVIQAGIEEGIYPHLVEIELDPSCLMKSVRAYIVFKDLESCGEIISTDPEIEDIEGGEFDIGFSAVVLSNMSSSDIQNQIENIPEVDKCAVKRLEIGEKEGNVKSHRKSEAKKEEDRQHVVQISKNIRVDVTRLDNLMNLVSELIIAKNSIEDVQKYEGIAEMEDSIEYLQRITSELHEAVMQVRMVPIGTVFNRFPRLIRDLSRQLDKDIDLNIYGEDTEVDRTIVDEIGDPLLHLIRNSADHGIEHGDLRTSLGKPSKGAIDLTAYHDGNNIVIEVSDDGHGIDADEIRDKLISKSLLSDGEVESLDDREVVQYLFHPGFSTSKNISNISGRGVGLDVVKTTIESLGGRVEIETTKDIGTKFIIRLPLTLSIIKALLVNIGSEAYVIPLSNVREIVELSPEAIEIFDNRELISLRGELMPFVRLHQVLDIDSQELPDNMTVIIASRGDRSVALLIDSLIDQQDIVIKPLGRYLSKVDILSGATILGDGSLALILDINNIV